MNIPEISAAEAAALINHGEWIGVGGFGPAGAPKTIPPAIAAKARKEHEAGHPFKVNIVTGASIGARRRPTPSTSVCRFPSIQKFAKHTTAVA